MTTTSEASVPVPIPGKRNVLVTSALPYVNNYPHLGNIIGAVLSGDVYSRYLRQRGTNVIYVCGTDEYGTATETKAQLENLTPRQICDKYHALHRQVYEWFDIGFDVFGRTSTPRQTQVVQEIFWSVYKNGFISEDTIEQLYCNACERFLADRYVNGTCPNCGYNDARGDQCDSCSKMLNPTELINPRCSTCSNPPVIRSTKHLFLDLAALQPKLESWISDASVAGHWTTNALGMTKAWLGDGLKKRCITRDLKWGVPVPLEGFTDKVFYVWFDAPMGYPSITAGLCGDDWRKWWRPEEDIDVKLYQFMGKDNVPFHTIVFPGALLATDENWTMLHHISTTEYLNYESGKFSKSRGVGVFGNDAIDSGIPSEVWRYYLLINRPEGSDALFTWDDLAAKNNDELINTLGNYINRTVTFLYKSFGGVLPELIEDDPLSLEYTEKVNAELKEYIALMEKVSLKAGLKKAMAIASLGNQYLQAKAPWKLLKQGAKDEAGSSLAYSANLALLVAVVFEPFMGPKFSKKVFRQLGLEFEPGVNNLIPDEFEPLYWIKPGQQTKQPEILFTTLTKDQLAAYRKRYGGEQESTSEAVDGAGKDGEGFGLDLRVGKIVEINEHPDSDQLYTSKIDVGEESPRNVAAGLRQNFSAEELLNRKVVLVCNLKPVALSGFESQGMILTGEKKKVMNLLAVDEAAQLGEKLVPDGMGLSIGNTPLDRKGFQTASKKLRVGKDGAIVFDKKYPLVLDSNRSCPIVSPGVPEGGKVK